MSAISETIVREFLEASGFLVQQGRKFVAPGKAPKGPAAEPLSAGSSITLAVAASGSAGVIRFGGGGNHSAALRFPDGAREMELQGGGGLLVNGIDVVSLCGLR